MSALWTRDEVALLCAHYYREGYSWDEWESLLPGRSSEAIRHKAMTLGITYDEDPMPEKRVRRKMNRKRMYIMDESEQYILAGLKYGMTLSEIDRKRGWYPGRAKMILTEMWRREWEYEDA